MGHLEGGRGTLETSRPPSVPAAARPQPSRPRPPSVPTLRSTCNKLRAPARSAAARTYRRARTHDSKGAEMDRDKLRSVVEGIPPGRWMSYADVCVAAGG